ncbi:MAG: MFS transporter [Acidimicrobiia bacterium]|nr:MFS transporter [Acidimicrobiia bacterium]
MGARPRAFYGWFVALAAFAVLATAYGAQFSYGVFVRAIEDDTGWSRGQLAYPQSIYIFVYSVLSVASGWATDRFGPRVVVALGAVLLGSGYVLMSRVQELWQVYLVLGLVAGVGMSASFVPCNATVVRWFVRRRGRALSISSSGGSVGNIVAPLAAAALIGSIGWRSGFAVIGIVSAAVMLVCAAVLVRDPEQLGLRPDGDPPLPARARGGEEPLALGAAVDVDASAPASITEASYTARQAVGTGSFWVMFFVFLLTWMAVFVPMVHLPAFAEDLGHSKVAAASVLSAVGVGGLVGRLSMGTASDHVGRRPALAAMMGIQVIGFAGLAASSGLIPLYLSAVVFGFAYGGGVVIFPALVGDFFGRASAGAIVGMIFAGAGGPAAAGPFLAGYLFDATGSYRISLLAGVAVNLAALALITRLRPPAGRPVPVGAAQQAAPPAVGPAPSTAGG